MHCIPITPAKRKKQRLCQMLCVRDAACTLENVREQRADVTRDRAFSLQERRIGQIFRHCNNPYEIWHFCNFGIRFRVITSVRSKDRPHARNGARNVQ
jgi:hypothetical protein